MNEVDIRLIRLEETQFVHGAVLNGLIAAVTLMPNGQLIQPTLVSSLRDSMNKRTFPGMDTATAELHSKEFRAAVESLVSLLEKP